MPMKAVISRWFQYLYFLRFSLFGWLFLPLLCLLDLLGVTATLTRGILTLDSGWQSFYAAFFVVATNMTVLVTTRNTVRNGRSRFLSTPPPDLYDRLTDPSPKAVWWVLGIAHIPTLLTLIYLTCIAFYEQEHLYILSLLAGLLAALAFWYLVSLFYYWIYRPDVSPLTGTGVTPEPAALIFPRYDWLFGDVTEAVPPSRLVKWVDETTELFLKKVSRPGYAATIKGPLWELHFLSTLSLVGIFILYLFLYPLTSPILRSRFATYGQILLCAAVTVVFVAAIADTSYKSLVTGKPCRWGRPVKWTFILAALSLSILFIVMLLFDRYSHSVRLALAFPTLGSILLLLGFFLWFFAGAAFFLDRYRLPVLTVVLAFIFLPKMVAPSVGGWLMKNNSPLLAEVFDSDHYFSVNWRHDPLSIADVPTPAGALKQRVRDPDEPYIIVTASGGGIQAAEWTSQILANLEKAFANDDRLKNRAVPYTFHDHVLLTSTVSGGSVGVMPFLLECTAHVQGNRDEPAPIFPVSDPDLFDRITRPSGCSSLEAVGWGLSYHDFYRLIVPLRLPTSLDDDSSPDRSWALAAAFNRNLHDEHCGTDRKIEGKHPRFEKLPPILDGEAFTLRDAAERLAHGSIPAFTLNTTAAESGSRFLLSDYRVPTGVCGTNFTPAESFLQVYGADESDCGGSNGKPLRYADLPLATAARLSATFPIVSSGTRIPPAYTRQAYHFLDGGYFDNDGTASVIEFLKSAMNENPSTVPHKILLIEIRDDDGTDVGSDVDNLVGQNGTDDAGRMRAPPWTPVSQLTGIVEGLWNAGHVSIARRNRRELCILETAYQANGLDIHHIIFTIPKGKDDLSPLSWNLTTGQLASITQRINSTQTKDYVEGSIYWVSEALNGKTTPTTDVCQAWVEPPGNTPLQPSSR
jgi:hypothetical protein